MSGIILDFRLISKAEENQKRICKGCTLALKVAIASMTSKLHTLTVYTIYYYQKNNCVAQLLERCLVLKTADTAPRVRQVADLDQMFTI